MTTLSSLYVNHQGKVSDKWTHYLEAYNQHFAPYQNKAIRLLEVGIQNGGSLEIWSQYFAQAEALVGCDINPDCLKLKYDDERIAMVVADANSDYAQQAIMTHSSSFDIVIDDGSHRSADIVRTFARYFNYLNDDGLFVVEDLHCSYWAEFDGGCYDPYSSISFFKKLVDMTNFEHWGADVSRVSFLDGFAKKYDIEFTEDVLASIYSVEFSNSLCFIRKRSQPQGQQLGKRVVAGQCAEVVPSILDLGGTICPNLSEADGVWSVNNGSIEERYFSTLAVVKDKEQSLNHLRQLIAERDLELAQLHEVMLNKNAHLADLQQALAGKDAYIADLRLVIADKDLHIADFRQVITIKEHQIGDLSQVIANKESEIVSLNQAIIDKDVDIADLCQVMVDKDNQIVDLNQVVMDKNNKITQLDDEMIHYKDKMVQMWFALRS